MKTIGGNNWEKNEERNIYIYIDYYITLKIKVYDFYLHTIN